MKIFGLSSKKLTVFPVSRKTTFYAADTAISAGSIGIWEHNEQLESRGLDVDPTLRIEVRDQSVHSTTTFPCSMFIPQTNPISPVFWGVNSISTA
jgi:hypothetical protein